jgi:hypothetical protein
MADAPQPGAALPEVSVFFSLLLAPFGVTQVDGELQFAACVQAGPVGSVCAGGRLLARGHQGQAGARKRFPLMDDCAAGAAHLQGAAGQTEGRTLDRGGQDGWTRVLELGSVTFFAQNLRQLGAMFLEVLNQWRNKDFAGWAANPK